MIHYHSDSNYLRYAPIYVKCAIVAGCAFLSGILFAYSYNSISPMPGEMESFGELGNLLAFICVIATFVAVTLTCLSVYSYLFMPDTMRIRSMIQQGLYQPSRGNPLHLRDGELLPKIACKRVSPGTYELVISAQEGATVDTIINAAPSISAALNNRYQRYAVIQTDADVAFNSVTFVIEDVKVDRSISYSSVKEMQPESPTILRVDQTTYIDLTTSGSMLVSGKTRSGKTTGVIALLIQVLLCGPDDAGSSIIIIDPKQAKLSRLHHAITLDDDGEATNIMNALKAYADAIKQRQKMLNDLSVQLGDAIKWWNAGMHPSFLFIDEYVSCRSIFPKKASKDSDYCLETFDALLKRIVTMGASAGCFVIVSIAEASVQEGGLPAMLRSAMSTKILFRPTLTEGRLMWDGEKLSNFSTDRVYGPGDAWFSSTDGIHDAVSFIHFPHMQFPVYKELGRLLQEYYD